MSAGNAITVAPLLSTVPKYYGACTTPGFASVSLGTFSPPGANSAITATTQTHGAAPLGVSIVGGGLRVVNAGLYRARGRVLLTQGRSGGSIDNISVSLFGAMVGGGAPREHMRVMPNPGDPNTGLLEGEIDALVQLAANATINLSLHQGLVNGVLNGMATFKLESMF